MTAHENEAGLKADTASPKSDKTIVLVGLMGAGKTTVGRRLAKKLGLEFADSDFEIEKAAQMSVGEIFETYGEEYFRAGERRVIARLMGGPSRVLATGGGAFINDETRELMKSEAITIWLDATLQVLVERTGRRDTRPLLKNGDPEDILKKLLQERGPIYAEADIHIQSSDGPHDEVVDAIIAALEQRDLVNV
ncbi:MAG: shikimate kinase [Kordiimonadaceae bacterium]|nr:shikimate kinase [Kordiimonadaceae bacterium]MBO6568939.1 shikimate kinase [Kordiimonadaceae bacterium]MBO6965086.1 shikimate kinase [Kordiimonadaceae bacterium]